MRLNNILGLVEIAVLGALFGCIAAKRDYKIIFKECNFTVLHPTIMIMSKVNCSVTKSSTDPERTLLNGVFALSEDVSDFDLRISLDMLRKDNTKINLLNQELNGCKFFRSDYNHNLLQNVLQELRRCSNLPKKCPFKSQNLYLVNGFSINEEHYPDFLPSLSFIFKIKFYLKKVHEGDLVITGRVKKNN